VKRGTWLGACRAAALFALALALPDAGAQSLNDCFVAAGQRYNVSPLLLWSIAKEESGFNPRAINRNKATAGKRQTYDYGIMQVNDSWLPTLSRYGISRAHLFDPCVNIHVGAWIFAIGANRHGYNWQALSAYNTGHPTRGRGYAAKVLGTAYKYAR